MVHEEVHVREIRGRLDQIARMVVLHDRSERQALVHAETTYPERTGLLKHGIGDALIVEEPAAIEALRRGPRVCLPGVDLERGRLHLHEVEIGLAELWRDEAMGQ